MPAASQAAARGRRKRRQREFVNRAKSLGRCADCRGSFHPAAMDFHHLDAATKIADINTMIKTDAGRLRLKAEIRKCALLCANCHRVRHFLSQSQSAKELTPA